MIGHVIDHIALSLHQWVYLCQAFFASLAGRFKSR
jgi:hypothetical protein